MKDALALALALACAALGPLAGCKDPGGGAPPLASAASTASVPAVIATVAVRGAPPAPSASSPREGSTIARLGDVLFVADEDHSVVRVLSLPVEVGSERVDVATPGRPATLVTAGDRVLVTIRDTGAGGGALLVFARKGRTGLEEVGRVALPTDAWGLAISPDGRTALVTSAWTHKLSAVDLGALTVRWSVDVAREPRGVTILPGGDRAYVSHLIGGAVTRVDGISASRPPVVARVDLLASPLRSPYNAKLPASNGWAVTTNPAGDRVYFPRHALGALGPDDWFGEGVVDVMLAASETNAAPPRRAVAPVSFTSVVAKAMETQKWMAGVSPTPDKFVRVVEPHAAVYRRKTDTLLLASSGTDTLLELDALAMDPTATSVRDYGVGSPYDEKTGSRAHGSAPQGIALSEDEDQAYVFCRGSDDLVVVNLAPADGRYRVAPSNAVPFPNDDAKDLVAGRQLFLNGNNGHLSGGLACNSCHPEGRDDGFVWHEVTLKNDGNTFTNFFAGTDLSAIRSRWGNVEVQGEGGFGYARQTPMLAGRVRAKGPYGWHAENETLEARIMAGFSLHRWNGGRANTTIVEVYATRLAAFVREGLTPPPRDERALTEEEARGRAIFESPVAKCATCHVPASDYTDRLAVPLKALRPPASFAEDPNHAYKTPSLRYVGGTAPYMHDGRFESLESLVELNQDRMGKTSQLSADEKKALVAFLRTL